MAKIFDVNDFPEAVAGKINELLETSHTSYKNIDVDSDDFDYFNSFLHIIEGYGYMVVTRYDKEAELIHMYLIKIPDFKNMDKDTYQFKISPDVDLSEKPVVLEDFSIQYYRNICNDTFKNTDVIE